MKLDTKKTIYVGFAFLIICMFWQVYDNIIAKMLINSFGFNQTWSGVIMALDNVLALILLPIFGIISDRTKNKRGRRVPFIIWGVIISAILITGVAIFDSFQQNAVAAANISTITSEIIMVGGVQTKVYIFNGMQYATNELAVLARSPMVMEVTLNNIFYLLAFLGVLFLVLIAMSIYRTPAVSLMPDVTPKPLRSKANAIINLLGTLGGIISLGLMSFLAKDYQSYILLFIVLALAMIALLVFFLIKVNEPKLVKEMHEESKKYGIEEIEETTADGEIPVKEKMSPVVRKSFILIMASIVFWFMAYNAATTKFSVYSQIVLGMGFTLPLLIAQVTAVVCFIPIGIIASKVGRKKTVISGIIILTIAFILGSIATEQTRILIYITMGLAGVGWATINVNSYPMIVEMSKGNNIGKYTGFYYFASMSAQIATPILSGMLMDSALGMRSLFPYAVFFCVLAFITFTFVKHGDSKPIPKKLVESY